MVALCSLSAAGAGPRSRGATTRRRGAASAHGSRLLSGVAVAFYGFGLGEIGWGLVPIVAVLGNHDYESGTPETVTEILTKAGVRVLDGEACEIEGVGIAGAKGFAGGFGRGSLGAWGEPAIKLFVQEALNESMKLESALAKLRMPRRIALLHYSPIAGTLDGEPLEIFPFLGSSRLEEPLLRYPVDAVFHGHAHRGAPESRTLNGVPVYNVARPLLLRTRPDQPPFRLFELPREPA